MKRKSGTASLNTDSQWSKQEACFACATREWLAVNLADEFDVGSVMHGVPHGAAVNKICVIIEAMKG